MVNSSTIKRIFSKYRYLLGISSGVATWLILAFHFNKPNDLSPAICVLLMMLVSNVFEPKLATGLSAIMGLIVGIVWNINILIQSLDSLKAYEIFGTLIGINLGIVVYIAIFAFIGLFYGSITKLFNRGAIF